MSSHRIYDKQLRLVKQCCN